MELIVCKSILHTVASNDFSHVVKGVVSVGDMRKLGAICLLAGDLSGSAGVVILVGSLVTKSVGYFLVTGGVAVNRVGGLVTASIGFFNEVITCIITCLQSSSALNLKER